MNEVQTVGWNWENWENSKTIGIRMQKIKYPTKRNKKLTLHEEKRNAYSIKMC